MGGFKWLWNVQIWGDFVCAETTGLRRRGRVSAHSKWVGWCSGWSRAGHDV